MDNALSEIIKSFTHFLRDFLIYFVSGLIVSLNIFIIDYLYYNSSLWELLESRNLILINLLLCYVLGHICMAVYFVLIEITGIDKKIKKCLKVGKPKEEILPELYDEKTNIYKHFIERYDNLNLFRWNLSAGFFINGMANFIYYIKYSYWQILLLMIMSFVLAVILYLLSIVTEKDYKKRIKYVENYINSKD